MIIGDSLHAPQNTPTINGDVVFRSSCTLINIGQNDVFELLKVGRPSIFMFSDNVCGSSPYEESVSLRILPNPKCQYSPHVFDSNEMQMLRGVRTKVLASLGKTLSGIWHFNMTSK